MLRSRNSLRFVSLLSCALLAACGSSDEEPDPKPNPQPKPVANKANDFAELLDAKADPIVLDGRMVALTGAPGGAYYEIGRGLRNEADHTHAALVPTAGSLEALNLLAWGAGDVAFVQADVLQDPRNRVLRASVVPVKPMFTEEVHILVSKGNAPKALLDLTGKRVGVGPAGSGSPTTAENLFWAGGVYDVTLVPGSFADNLKALASGELAAVIVVGGQPVPSLLGKPDVSVMDLGAERDALLTEMQKLNEHYMAASVDAASGGPAETIAVPSVLVARAGYEGAIGIRLDESPHPKFAEYQTWGASEDASSLVMDLDTRPGSSIQLRDPALPLRLIAGREAGYANAASALKKGWEAGGASVLVVSSGGSLQNLAVLAAGQAELAIVQEDVLLEAMMRPSTARLLARVRIVVPLFSQSIHLVQKDGAGIADAVALRGKDVTLGAPGSGLWVSARRLLRQKRVLSDHYTGRLSGASAAWFRHGAPQSGEASISLGDAEGYEASEGGVKTRALLLCRRDLSDEVVSALTTALFAQRKNLASADERLGQLDPDKTVTGKVHPGVAKALDAGVSPDSAEGWK